MYRIVVDPAVMVDRIGNRSPVLDEFLAFSLRLFEAVQVQGSRGLLFDVGLSSFTLSGTFLSNYLASSRPDEDPLQHSYLRRRITGLPRTRTTVLDPCLSQVRKSPDSTSSRRQDFSPLPPD